jgi:flagellar motor switch protein FliG
MKNAISVSPKAAPQALTPAQKAAIVLAALPRETAKAIVAEVGDEHLNAFVRAIGEMSPPPPHARLSIAQEFIAEVLQRGQESPAGAEVASNILYEITDKVRAEKVLARVSGSGEGLTDFWRRAAALPTERLVAFLLSQRIPTAAAILSNLPADRAAEVLATAPIEFSRAAAAAIARLERSDAATNEAIARAIDAELISAPAPPKAVKTASALVIDILDLLPASLRDSLIEHLQASDEGIAASIRRTLLTFENLPARLTEVAVAALIRTADREAILRALKHGETNAAETVDFLLANISKRMADQLREELAALAAPLAPEGEGAQRSVVAAIKGLEKSGEIKLKPAT